MERARRALLEAELALEACKVALAREVSEAGKQIARARAEVDSMLDRMNQLRVSALDS